MAYGVWAYVAWMGMVAFIGLCLLLWGWMTGQFKDIEAAKYKMLEDREPEPWPGREGGGK